LPAYRSLDLYSDAWYFQNSFVYTMILITSLLNGLGEGVSQPASGTYISDCAIEQNKGFYFALFWSFYMGSQVFGNLIAAFVLGNIDQQYYVLIMTGMCILGIILFFFLKPPIVQHDNLRKEIKDEVTKSVRMNNKQSMISTVPNEVIVANTSLWGSVKSMWRMTIDHRFKWLIP
jgi:MFS family permease